MKRLERTLLATALVALAFTTSAYAELLPGFRIEKLAKFKGFCTSIVTDSKGTIYYTNTAGDVFRLDGTESVLIVHVDAGVDGNAGLLGMALENDHSAVVHYTSHEIAYEVISRIDLETGQETIITQLACDISYPGRPVASEHHGGNPIVVDDGSIYFAVGEFDAGMIAADPAWNAGKIFHVYPDGRALKVASGFRNPFDLAWDPESGRLVVPDNGDKIDDEINVIAGGGFFGWPYTAGDEPPVEGAIAPRYVFPRVVAPTGIVRLTGRNPMLRHGYLLGTFVGHSLLYIEDVDAHPFADPLPLMVEEIGSVIDVFEGPDGTIYVASGFAVYRLVTPKAGDCNGDGALDFQDVGALDLELADGQRQPVSAAQEGVHRGSFGCDADGDGWISAQDRPVLWNLVVSRKYSVRRGR